jgi:hypothetical protein
LISASQVAGVTYVSHWCPVNYFYFHTVYQVLQSYSRPHHPFHDSPLLSSPRFYWPSANKIHLLKNCRCVRKRFTPFIQIKMSFIFLGKVPQPPQRLFWPHIQNCLLSLFFFL